MSSPDSVLPLISAVSGGASLAAWIVAQLPQLVETYNQKSVEGLSGFFVLIWITGDVCSFIGCVLTEQMYFQFILALYFLFNDMLLAGQYYYYGFYLKKKKHHHHHHHHHHNHSHTQVNYDSTAEMEQSVQTKKSSSSLTAAARAVVPATILATQIGQGHAFPIGDISSSVVAPVLTQGQKLLLIGTVFAWTGAALYFFSRIPQLIKNYQRKSTEDVSPFLFACTLIGNITYTVSILTSCDFVSEETRWEFFYNELPYMIGSAGTIIFDVIYFYQLWLYTEAENKSDEQQPLLTSS